MSRRGFELVLILVTLWACGGGDSVIETQGGGSKSPGWHLMTVEELAPEQLEQLERALAAKDEMARTLMGELKSELELGGPPGAVVVCREMAPMIAEHVADGHSLRIGRTSHRLRNPANTAPGWAESELNEDANAPVYLEGPEGELGIILPINLAAPCLACHGQPESLAEDVRSVLVENYPDDQAVGFSEGDLRGWFWVEVPAQ